VSKAQLAERLGVDEKEVAGCWIATAAQSFLVLLRPLACLVAA
jgi:hypothetical protein